jgi:hypothetical protein
MRPMPPGIAGVPLSLFGPFGDHGFCGDDNPAIDAGRCCNLDAVVPFVGCVILLMHSLRLEKGPEEMCCHPQSRTSSFRSLKAQYGSTTLASPTRQASGELIWSVIASGIWKSLQNCNGDSLR